MFTSTDYMYCSPLTTQHFSRSRVHLHNVDALLMMALPFHDTNEFVRIVQICDLSTARLWQWLTPMQQSGAALPRSVLVQRCGHDRALFDRICQGALQAGSTAQLSRSLVGLYAVVTCQALAARPRMDEGTLQHLLPYLLAGLAPAASVDLTCATIMVVAQLATTTTLGVDVVQGAHDTRIDAAFMSRTYAQRKIACCTLLWVSCRLIVQTQHCVVPYSVSSRGWQGSCP